MPNWVNNDVFIKASDEKLRAFAERHIVDGNFDFSTIIPITLSDDEYHGTEIRTFNDGTEYRTGGLWYGWNNAHWGTKWNARYTNAEDFTETGFFSFQTAWGHPLPVMEALVKMYPTFDIEWKFVEEQGWGGVHIYQNGRELLTQRREWDIPTTHDERMDVFEYCFACEDGDEEDMEEWGCPKVTA